METTLFELGNKIEVKRTVIPPWTKPVEGMKSIFGDIEDQYRIQYTPNVVYVQRHRDLHLQFLTHRAPMPGKRYPAILYIRGSGWMEQDVYGIIPQMVEIARCGYVVACMEYRHIEEGCGFPAQIEDAKAAIHYLKKNSEELGIDPQRIAIWGDSSGGHTALMTGFTGNRDFCSEQEQNEDLSVRCIVDFFGPSDFNQIGEWPSGVDHCTRNSVEAKLLGNTISEIPQKAAIASPIHYITKEEELPPVLIIHGDRDDMVPFHQSVILYETLRNCGKSVEFYMVRNGAHGFRIWTEAVIKIVKDFLGAHL